MQAPTCQAQAVAHADEADKQEDGETSPLLENVHFVAIDGKDMGLLWEVQPAFVIVYNPDISFVRQLEVQSTSRQSPQAAICYLDAGAAFMSSTYQFILCITKVEATSSIRLLICIDS